MSEFTDSQSLPLERSLQIDSPPNINNSEAVRSGQLSNTSQLNMFATDSVKEKDVNNDDSESFRFLDLADEQRNAIFRSLFDDITTPDKQFHIWKEKEGLPRYPGLRTYQALVLTSRQVKHEASTIFESEHLPRMRLYFDNLKDLLKLSGPMADNKVKEAGTRFLLMSPTCKVFMFCMQPAKLLLAASRKENRIWPFIPNAGVWPETGKYGAERAWSKGGDLVARSATHDGVTYETTKLQGMSSGARAFFFERSSSIDFEMASIVEGRLSDVNWTARIGGGEVKDLDDWLAEWDAKKAQREAKKDLPFNHVRQLPAMEDMWW